MKHTKFFVLFLMFALLDTGIFFVPRVEAEEQMQSLQEVYEEELYAEEMYRQMAESFDNADFYNRLMSAETRHALSVKRVMEYKQIRVTEPKIELTIEEDELKALEIALQYEKDDVASLEKRIAESTDEVELILYNRLKDRSERHVATLERAIAAYQEGETDLNQICDGNCDMRRGACRGNSCGGQKDRGGRECQRQENQRGQGQRGNKGQSSCRGGNCNGEREDRKGQSANRPAQGKGRRPQGNCGNCSQP